MEAIERRDADNSKKSHCAILLQRGDGFRRAAAAGKTPIRAQIFLMSRRPFANESQSPRRQAARVDGTRLDLHEYFVLAVLRMKMRRRVVVVEHGTANLRVGALEDPVRSSPASGSNLGPAHRAVPANSPPPK